MVQKYKTSDINLFSKINLEDKNYLTKKSELKPFLKKPKSSYKNQDTNKFEQLEGSLVNNDFKKEENLFFSQNNIDDCSSFTEISPLTSPPTALSVNPPAFTAEFTCSMLSKSFRWLMLTVK